MTKEEFKKISPWDLVVSRDKRGRTKVLSRIGPIHWRQGLGEKELFAWFRFVNSGIKTIKTHNEVNFPEGR